MKRKIIIQLSSIVSWILVVGLLGFLISKWSLFWSHLEYGDIRCCFIGNRLKDCMDLSVCAIKEEIIYRFVPFLVATSIAMLLKSKKAKTITMIMCIIVIIMIQLYFGYKHFHPEYGDTNYWFNIVLQGGLGIFLACIYGFVFWLGMKTFYSKNHHLVLTFLMCHTVALITTILVHSINNSLIVIAYTF